MKDIMKDIYELMKYRLIEAEKEDPWEQIKRNIRIKNRTERYAKLEKEAAEEIARKKEKSVRAKRREEMLGHPNALGAIERLMNAVRKPKDKDEKKEDK